MGPSSRSSFLRNSCGSNKSMLYRAFHRNVISPQSIGTAKRVFHKLNDTNLKSSACIKALGYISVPPVNLITYASLIDLRN